MWQALIAHAMAMVIFLTLMVPLQGFATGPVPDLASAAITNTTGDTDVPSPSGDAGLVQHAHCACHSAVRPSWSAVSVERVRSAADHPARSDAAPRPGPGSLPFKPPRA
ncbi:MAG: hypothetical protein DI537_32480 [Stutzerimonas stutzeri]|nr:MAG: hypothetical protein DI537_32480 [Stutzerimonas stutzeri]